MNILGEYTVSYLYRGVNKTLDEKNQGKLCPKGNEEKTVFKVNNLTPLKIDNVSPWVIGNSEINAQRFHQLDIEPERWAWVSFSREREIAVKFATTDNSEDGFVYTIEEKELEKYGVVKLEKPYQENSHEVEVTLRTKHNGCLPEEIVVSREEVKHTNHR